jgi:ribosomal protein S9
VGGGLHGQSECMSVALTRALIKINVKYRSILAGFGLVGFDSRAK